jgi:murein DD-endopeptidase MepM/ murein hydrolase activator NlpD
MLNRVLIGVGALILIVFGIIWFSGDVPVVRMAQPVVAIGQDTPITVVAEDPHGTKEVTAFVEQDGQRQDVFVDRNKSKQTSRAIAFPAGKKEASSLKDGSAKLVIEVTSNDLRGAAATLSQDVQVVLRPPTVTTDGAQHYINQGGAELVTFDVGGSWSEAGVQAGKYTSLSFPMPGEHGTSNKRFSLFAYPWDLPTGTTPVVFVRNVAATEVTSSFWTQIKREKFHESEINLSTANLEKFVNELDPQGSGDLVTRYVKINRDMRKQNDQTIFNLRTKTEMRMLWSGAFEPMKGKRESYFAGSRTYKYNGKVIDKEVHLGYDIAQTVNRPVRAANSGKIIYADRLGIYGNCVIIDHGYSLQTLYGHLSKIEVKVGDAVEKNREIGISGTTGLALGDHVHFSTLVSGWEVEPKEWWDEHWLHDRILSKIGSNAGPQRPKKAEPDLPSAKAGKKKHRRR